MTHHHRYNQECLYCGKLSVGVVGSVVKSESLNISKTPK